MVGEVGRDVADPAGQLVLAEPADVDAGQLRRCAATSPELVSTTQAMTRTTSSTTGSRTTGAASGAGGGFVGLGDGRRAGEVGRPRRGLGAVRHLRRVR